MSHLEDYREVVPKGTVDFLKRLAEHVNGRKILHINSTKLGGGVAEMLRSHIPLLQDVGIEAQWQTISGTEEFFNITKSFHNALQGQDQHFSEQMFQEYLKIN